jgi:hypothetical protein
MAMKMSMLVFWVVLPSELVGRYLQVDSTNREAQLFIKYTQIMTYYLINAMGKNCS